MIYFVQAGEGGPIKIGHAKNVQRRLHQISVHNHENVRLIGQLEGGVVEEARLHLLFDDSHVRGEWFRPTPQLLALIAEHPVAPRPKWRRIIVLPADASLERRVIHAFGSCTELARILDENPGLVHGWWQGNRIPHWRVNSILKAAETAGVVLPAEFLRRHAPAKVAA